MEILGIEIYPEKRKIYAKLNPLKKEIKIIKPSSKAKAIASIPTIKSTFRIFELDIKEKSKIKKAIETNISIEFPNFENLEYSYYQYKNKIFCVITKKEYIEQIKQKFNNLSSIDSDIFSIIRVLNFNNITSGEVIHFYKNEAFYLKIESNFPKEVKTITIEEAKNLATNDTFLSGYIPKNIKGKILNNSLNEPSLNIAFGNILKPAYEIGVDFLHRESKLSLKTLITFSILLILTFLFINIGLFIKDYQLKKELNLTKSKEKEIYLKYFGEIPVDPLSQAKGKVKNLNKSKEHKKDVADILDFIGKTKKDINNLKIMNIKASFETISIKGYASSIEDITKFTENLKKKFSFVKIVESSKDADGKIRFKLEIKS
ncbi:hypothetical protein [Hydrogenothermus marinus]|uniref:GspL periplasmic domain-containing protein n=1 Tax=Hydrogenothermus marinus TaxID=133270 RepID=A0A3M0B721_9AQUI|nr:hypothetical protein [Hydrogenothermus marinus]RMA93163.1 hypothetical protein CLV39_1218 [Hydrogenothermus marinus]